MQTCAAGQESDHGQECSRQPARPAGSIWGSSDIMSRHSQCFTLLLGIRAVGCLVSGWGRRSCRVHSLFQHPGRLLPGMLSGRMHQLQRHLQLLWTCCCCKMPGMQQTSYACRVQDMGISPLPGSALTQRSTTHGLAEMQRTADPRYIYQQPFAHPNRPCSAVAVSCCPCRNQRVVVGCYHRPCLVVVVSCCLCWAQGAEGCCPCWNLTDEVVVGCYPCWALRAAVGSCRTAPGWWEVVEEDCGWSDLQGTQYGCSAGQSSLASASSSLHHPHSDCTAALAVRQACTDAKGADAGTNVRLLEACSALCQRLWQGNTCGWGRRWAVDKLVCWRWGRWRPVRLVCSSHNTDMSARQHARILP